MLRYIFNARDIAAYFKYFSVPSYLEVSYMQYVFNLGKGILAVPLTRDFEFFKKEVFRELYFLWANGFENERSDISNMTDDGQLALLCDQDCINLESYMKLITLHLIFTRNLPYVNLNFTGLPLQLGIRCDFSLYEENVIKVVKALNLDTADAFGKKFDIDMGVPDELLRVSLNDEIKSVLTKSTDFKESLRNEQKSKMKELKEKSLKLLGAGCGSRKVIKAKGVSRSERKKVSGSANQPKGAPLKKKDN
ncbi:MAG: hypothetical protein J5786_01505 [Clostridiales bacterium]|nr:hypothetical protein [Clostridiales bacterium]